MLLTNYPMPDLILNIKTQLDPTSVKDTIDLLDKLENRESPKTSGAPKQTEENKALNQELTRRIRLNEELFRRGKVSQQQALQSAAAIEQQAQAQGLLNTESIRGVQNLRTLGNSQRRIEQGFTGIAGQSATANRALVNLGRIVQDLPFGFLGISNNISPMLEVFKQLRDETGSTIGALKGMLTSLTGAGGLIFALGSLLPTAFLVAQTGFNFFKKNVKESENLLKSLTDEIIKLQVGDQGAFDLKSINLAAIKTFEIANNYKAYAESIKDPDRRKALENESERLTEQSLLAQDKANALVASIVAQTKLTEAQVRSNLVAIEESRQRLEINDALREYQELRANAFRLEVDRLKSRELEIGVSAKINKLENQRIEAIEEAQRRAQEEFKIKRQSLIQERDLNRITKEAFRVKEQELINEIIRVRQRYQAELDGIEDARKARKQAQFEAVKQREKDRLDALKNVPGQQLSVEDDKELERALLAQELLVQRQVEQLKGFAREKAQIEADYQQEILSLGQQGLIDANILKELELAKTREIEQAKIKIHEKASRQIEQTNRAVARSTQQVYQAAFSALTSFSQGFAQDNKTLALTILGIEKGLAIGQVVVNGLKEAAKAKALAASFAANPITAPLAANALIQAAKIRTDTALTAALIAAQGLGEGVNIVNRGERSAGTTTGGGSSQRRGFFTETPDTQQPLRPFENVVNVYLEGELDSKLLSLKVREGDNNRKRGAVFIRSDQ